MLLYNTFFVWAASYDGLMPPLAVSQQTPHLRHSPASGEDEESAQILAAGEYAQSINQSINVKFVGRRYTTCPGAPTVVSG